MKILIASDHAGFELKKQVFEALKAEMNIEDLGPFSTDSVDYPDYANLVCKRIEPSNVNDNNASTHLSTFGILICGSGQGMAMRANRFPFIRAALCWSEEVATLARLHNDANVLCLGGRLTPFPVGEKILSAFLETAFEGGRHQGRVDKLQC
ncbi:MAG: ribose 5-phosphate isomerase B [Bdellovibrionaceae bacterium]|nr:ribose 5-phosphate isomerase B [Pseudobdellovibrionaceae bacterium]